MSRDLLPSVGYDVQTKYLPGSQISYRMNLQHGEFCMIIFTVVYRLQILHKNHATGFLVEVDTWQI